MTDHKSEPILCGVCGSDMHLADYHLAAEINPLAVLRSALAPAGMPYQSDSVRQAMAELERRERLLEDLKGWQDKTHGTATRYEDGSWALEWKDKHPVCEAQRYHHRVATNITLEKVLETVLKLT
jgi:hypothetical protein